MQATRAYIAGAGTAIVMLGASLCMFVLVSAFVTFGSWPGGKSHGKVDHVLLRDVVQPTPKTVAVRADAAVVATRAAQRAAAQRRTVARVTTPGTPVAVAPTTSTPAKRVPIRAPAPAGNAPVAQQQPQTVARNLDATTRDVATQVQEQATNVQTQVNEVVGQVIGGPQPNSNPGPIETVENAAGSLLGG